MKYLVLLVHLKRLTITQRLIKIKTKLLIIIMINSLLLPNLIILQKSFFDLTLKRANLTCQSGIANFVNKTDFDNKLIRLNKKN